MRFARSLYRTQSFCNSWNVTRARPNVIRTVRRTGSSLILESRWFANRWWSKDYVIRIVRRTGPSLILESRLFANIILESRLFANVTRIWQRTGYSLILEPRLFAWRLYEGQEPLQLQPGDWIPRMSNISSIVRNPPKWRSKQLCNQVGFFFSWIEWRPRIGWTGRVGNQSHATSGRVERKD